VEEQTNVEASRSSTYRLYSWNGRLHKLPECYRLPQGGPLEAWQHWCLGGGHPPLKSVNASNFSNSNARKRYCDLVLFCKEIERYSNVSVVRDLIHANELFKAWEGNFSIPESTTSNRKRRNNQLRWTTLVNVLRKQKQQAAIE
jgi:hypothetical protein